MNFLNIDAVMLIPDGTQVEIQREKSLTSDNTMKITLSIEVQTYYPAFRKPTLGDLKSGQFFNSYSWSNANSQLSNRFFDDSIPSDENRSDILPFPKRTKWYLNLRELSGKGSANESNPTFDDGLDAE